MGRSSPAVPFESETSSGDIQVIARVVALLECLDPDSPSLDAQTTAGVLGVGRSTAHRYLASLEKHGMLQRTDATTYELGPVLRRLGSLAVARLGVVEAAGPIMRELVDELGNTVVLSVWGGLAPVVARVTPDHSRITTIAVEVGRSLPAHTAQARVFDAWPGTGHARGAALGHLHAVADGDRVGDEAAGGGPDRDGDGDGGLIWVGDVPAARHSYAGGLKTIAAPVCTSEGSILASLAVIGLSMHMPEAEDDAVAARLVDAGSRLGAC